MPDFADKSNREETIARVIALPCFVRRALGLLDPDHKLLLLLLALMADDGRTVHLEHETARKLRIRSSFTPLRFAAAIRRLDRGGFLEVRGDVSTDRFTIYIATMFE